METKKNIYQKILAIMQEIKYLQKDDKVEFGNTKYKALSEEKVTVIMREQLVKHGLVVYPIRQESSRTGQITHVDVVYRMVNAENPEEYIEIVSCGDGADSQDKGAGKAMTYAFKYMWLRTFAIPTGDDPDKTSSEELDQQEKYCELCGEEIKGVKTKEKLIYPEEIKTKSLEEFGQRLCFNCYRAQRKARGEE